MHKIERRSAECAERDGLVTAKLVKVRLRDPLDDEVIDDARVGEKGTALRIGQAI